MSALCREIPAADEIFFATDIASVAIAKSVCDLCPLKTQCAREAVEIERGQHARDRFGVFGGMTPAERAAVDPGRECLDCGVSVQDREGPALRCMPCAVERRKVLRLESERRIRQAVAA